MRLLVFFRVCLAPAKKVLLGLTVKCLAEDNTLQFTLACGVDRA